MCFYEGATPGLPAIKINNYQCEKENKFPTLFINVACIKIKSVHPLKNHHQLESANAHAKQ